MITFQVLIHFAGVVHMSLMILARFSYTHLWPILVFYTIIPFLMELSVVFRAFSKFTIVGHIKERQIKRHDIINKKIEL